MKDMEQKGSKLALTMLLDSLMGMSNSKQIVSKLVSILYNCRTRKNLKNGQNFTTFRVNKMFSHKF
jgi:uncharacterized protein YjgD (DUF1641 family)